MTAMKRVLSYSATAVALTLGASVMACGTTVREPVYAGLSGSTAGLEKMPAEFSFRGDELTTSQESPEPIDSWRLARWP